MPRFRAVVWVMLGVGALAAADAAVAGPGDRFRSAAAVGWLCCLGLTLAGGGLLHQHWRRTRLPAFAWLAMASLSLGPFVAVMAEPRLVDTHVPAPRSSPLVDLLMLAWTTALLVQAARGRTVRHHLTPTVVGLTVATLGIAVDVALAGHAGRSGGPDLLNVPVALTALLLAVCIGLILRLTVLAPLTRRQLCLAMLLGVVARLVLVGSSSDRAAFVGGIVAVLAAAVLCCEAGVLLGERARLQEVVESLAPSHAETLHELRAGMAGVSSGVELLVHHESSLTDGQRASIKQMLVRETGRLQRLLATPGPRQVEMLEVDDLVAPLVTSRRLTGQQIGWDPSGHWVVGCEDDIVEAVNTLLVNAHHHAPGAPVELSVTGDDGCVQIRVADQGPGVPHELREAVFDRGVRGDGSAGQGLGLAAASRLIADQGGSVRLEEGAPGGGATFVVTLPGARKEQCA